MIMRKNELIELLATIDGNPEIVLWNGMVGDYMHIDNKLVEGDLVKMTLDYYLRTNLLRDCRDAKNWDLVHTPEEVQELKSAYKKYVAWETNQYVTDNDVENKRYKRKRVFYIDAKKRNQTFHDRMGSIEY
jgi:hypothetical protein